MNAKFKINTIEEFDLLADSMDETKIPEPKTEWKISRFKSLWTTFKAWLNNLSFYEKQTLPPSLLRLTLEGYFRAIQQNKPSDFVKTIADDLHLKLASINQYVSLYKHWQKQIMDIGKSFEKSQPDIKQDGYTEATWANIMLKHKLPNHIWVIDTIAKRFSITYEETYKMRVADAIIALTIDSCNTELQSKMQDHALQESKRRKK